MEVLKALVVVILLFVLGLCVEKLFHPSVDITKTTYLLKNDIVKVVKAVISKEKIRHTFDEDFFEKIKTVVKEYCAIGMDIDVIPCFNSGTYLIGVQFVPNKKFVVEELETITNRLKILFRRYLYKKQMNWRIFACFETGQDYVRVYLYYQEFPEDRENFERRYRETIREKVEVDFGYLRDDELDKELGNVD